MRHRDSPFPIHVPSGILKLNKASRHYDGYASFEVVINGPY